MGTASSRQKIAQPLLDAASSLLRRVQIWDRFQGLVNRIKHVVGFGRKPTTVSQTGSSPTEQQDTGLPAPSHQPGATNDRETTGENELVGNTNRASGDANSLAGSEASKNTEPASGSSARNDEGIAEHGPQSDLSEGDIIVGNMTQALAEALPSPSANAGASSQLVFPGPAAGGFDNTKPGSVSSISEDETTPEAEPQPAFNARKTYESRVEELDAAYSHAAPESERPPKPKANKDGPVDDYDSQIAEYVFSSLEVALPQPQDSGSGTDIAFRPPVYNRRKNNTVQANADSESTDSRAGTAALGPNERSSEPEVEAVTVNYRAWDREIYSNLRLDRSSIRLVEILPGSPGDDVYVRMNVHPLNEVAMQYEALSYVWGNPEPAKKIFVHKVEAPSDKVEVPINPNLYDALVSLRQPNCERRIWIDAICLNQTSFAEKSREVQKMGDIYSLAKVVNVFLGAPSLSNSTCISSFLKFLNRDDEGQAAVRYAEEGLRGLDRICEKCQTNVPDVCKGFMEACLQPWWGRIWTLQEFYLAENEPMWYWGRERASNGSLKRDFSLLMNLSWDLFRSEDANGRLLSDLKTKIAKPIGSFKVDVERISVLISRRYRIAGFDTPRRLYRELTARATNPRDFVYGLRAIFDPVFGRVFLPDYQMRTELLFACLAVFLIQFECWGDVLWWYPSRYAAGKGLFPSWLPNFTQRIVSHELDVQPLDQAAVEKPEPKLVVLNHRLHAEGYKLDKVYGHRHIDKSDGQKIFQELWQFDHCMNQNHECHEYFVKGAAPEDLWLQVFLDMYGSYYAKLTHFNSAFRGALLQSTVKPEDGEKLPRQVAECVPCWDLLQWHALRTTTPGLAAALGCDIDDAGSGCLENIFSPRMGIIFRKAFADFFIGACIFDWGHLSVWLNRFPNTTPFKSNDKYWSEIQESLLSDTEKRAKAITDAYDSYQAEIWPEVMRVSWCYSFYYTFLAYVILLDCDDHASLASMIPKLQASGEKLRGIYLSTTTIQIEILASVVPSVATRVSRYNTLIELFRGRYLIWTDRGFRGISCPGVETCCDKKSVVAIVDGLSFPVIVRDYDEETGEGQLAGCALIRGVDMLNRDAGAAALPPDYKRGEKRIFKFK